jgi:hypothetical protein
MDILMQTLNVRLWVSIPMRSRTAIGRLPPDAAAMTRVDPNPTSMTDRYRVISMPVCFGILWVPRAKRP